MKNFLKIVCFFLAQRACVAYIWLLFKYAFICIPYTGRHIRIWYSKSTISYTLLLYVLLGISVIMVAHARF